MNVARNHGYFEGVGRIRLHYRSWEPGAARGAIIVVPGLSDHSGRYAEFAEAVADFGFATFALDLRGHGYSDGRRGHAPGFDVFLQDLDRFRRQVQGLTRPGLPTFLLGQSMGGLVVLRYLQEYDAPLQGGILCSPWLGTALPIPRWKVNLAAVLSRLLPALPIKANIPAEELSHDPQVVRAYLDDPLVHDRITPRLFTEVSNAMGLASRRAERLHVPLLFLLGGGDHIVDTGRARGFAAALEGRAPDVTIRVYPGQYHELLNERDRMLVIGDLREWIAEHEHAAI